MQRAEVALMIEVSAGLGEGIRPLASLLGFQILRDRLAKRELVLGLPVRSIGARILPERDLGQHLLGCGSRLLSVEHLGRAEQHAACGPGASVLGDPTLKHPAADPDAQPVTEAYQ